MHKATNQIHSGNSSFLKVNELTYNYVVNRFNNDTSCAFRLLAFIGLMLMIIVNCDLQQVIERAHYSLKLLSVLCRQPN